MERTAGYAPIESYAAIGDGQATALVAADGSIDFLSLPTMQGPTTFGALLDPERGGRFVLQPEGRFDVERRYVERTNVLETTYRTGGGVVRVTDALTLRGGGQLPWREVARRVEGLAGEVPMRWSVEPRFDWGRTEPRLLRTRGIPVAEGDGIELGIHAWDAGEPELADGCVGARFVAGEGSHSLVAACATSRQPIPIPTRAEIERRLDETVESWREWLNAWDYDGPWHEHLERSALALKLLTFVPDGAIVAAPTTSLPERIGGDKNYDYRYMWVRDTAFTLDALMRLGLPEQVHASFCCLLNAVKTTAPDLLPFYSVEGHEARRHEELPLAGYRGSQPVRFGNAAASQLQLGSWGDLIETAGAYVSSGNAFDRDTGDLLAACVDRLVTLWRDEDSGMWELDEHRHYTSSKLGTWMAFDRALDLVECGQLPGTHGDLWRRERSAVRAFVEERCWSDEHGAYVEHAGSSSLDAGVLRAARMGWGEVAPDRLARTIDVIRDRLDAGSGLLYRTTWEAGQEGAFVACSFWLADALARTSRVDEAAELLERLLEHENDVGLLSEEIDPSSGAFLGNFPQGLSHLALINAACAIHDARAAGASATARVAAR